MSRQPVSIAALRRDSRAWISARSDLRSDLRSDVRDARPPITWWPVSLPGSDLEERQRRRSPQPTRRRLRRGRIQLVRG